MVLRPLHMLVATPLQFQLHTLDRVESVATPSKAVPLEVGRGGTGGNRNVGKMSIGDFGPEGYSSYVMDNMHMKEMRPAKEKKFSGDALALESFIRHFEENADCFPAIRPEVVFKKFMVWLKDSPLKVCKFLCQYDDPELALAEAKKILRQQFVPNAAGVSDVIDRLTKALAIPRKDTNLLRQFIADLRSRYLQFVQEVKVPSVTPMLFAESLRPGFQES
jgi:hypothetical protein